MKEETSSKISNNDNVYKRKINLLERNLSRVMAEKKQLLESNKQLEASTHHLKQEKTDLAHLNRDNQDIS